MSKGYDYALDVIKARIEAAGGKMPNDLQDLVGMVMQNDCFMSAACRLHGID